MSMHDDIWYEPVMPTAKEQRMMADARKRIAAKHRRECSDSTPDNAFSITGLAIAVFILLAIPLCFYGLLTVVVF
jgi:hypothetical protein